jgi:hypothetical protein
MPWYRERPYQKGQVFVKKVSEPLTMSRKGKTMSKPKVQSVYRCYGIRCIGTRLARAFIRNAGTYRYDGRRKHQVKDTPKRKVSRRSTGAEHPLVVKKLL